MRYAHAAERLGNRESRKLGNNTYLVRRDADTIALRLHATDVLTYHADGSVTYSTGGWQTVTTKSRLNEYGPDGFRVYSDRGQWKLYHYGAGEPVALYADGLTIAADGTISGAQSIEDAKAEKQFRKDAASYAKAYVDALYRGEIDTPSGGDCWGCYFQFTTPGANNPLGTDHLWGHMTPEERYYVPSLIWNAMDAAGASQMARWTVQQLQRHEGDYGNDRTSFIAEQIEKAIKSYLIKQHGLAAYTGAERGAARAWA